jgi:hypothetical protein
MPDILPISDAKDSNFYVTMEFETPQGFWEAEDFEHPFLVELHQALRRRGWGIENIEVIYSFFEESVQRVEDATDMRFWIWIPGSYLVEHPRLLADLPKLERFGVRWARPAQPGMQWTGIQYHLVHWHIYADSGPLKGQEWTHGTYFLVRHRRLHPEREGPKEWSPGIRGTRQLKER